MTCSVAVVGSANLDVVTSVDRFAGPGETVLGQSLEEVAGGKGLNQALAAGRRVPTAFVGSVGRDAAGELLRRQLSAAGVDTSRLQAAGRPSGRALIQVTGSGENSIVVVPLANDDVGPAWVEASLDALDPDVVLCQLEIPLPAVVASARWTQQRGARFVLNASPVIPLPDELLRACDPLVVNAGEGVTLLASTGTADPAGKPPSIDQLAQALGELVGSVLVTDGPGGVHLATPSGPSEHVPGHVVRVVDTTGAGDEFVGTLAAELSDGAALVEAAATANAAAAAIVQLPRSAR